MKPILVLALAAGLLLGACSRAAPPAAGQNPIRFATAWRAEAEQGGFYEALATGEYKKRGLDVTIIQGGPAVNVPQLLATGAIDLGMGSNSFIALNLANEKAPVKAVMATMQSDPQVLIAHPGQGLRWIADMKGKPILLSDASVTAFWVWLKAKYHFTDDQVRKYTHSSAQFLSDPRVLGRPPSEDPGADLVTGPPARLLAAVGGLPLPRVLRLFRRRVPLRDLRRPLSSARARDAVPTSRSPRSSAT